MANALMNKRTKVYAHSDNHIFNRVLYYCILLFHTLHTSFPRERVPSPLFHYTQGRTGPDSVPTVELLPGVSSRLSVSCLSLYARGCVERGAGPMPRPR